MYFLNFNDGFIEVPFASPSLNIYTVGCEHYCKGCHAKDLQNINHENRKELTFELIDKKLQMISDFYKSICWLGGDPFYQYMDCFAISKKIKEKYPEIKNVIYTGYQWKYFHEMNKLAYNLPFDYVIDGTWNGKKLGEEGCNQKIWKYNGSKFILFNYDEISYKEYCKGN